MTKQGALACGLVLMFAAAVPALPTTTKKHHHRSLEPSMYGGMDSDEAPDLERAHVAKVKSFDAAKGLEHARKERARAREHHAGKTGHGHHHAKPAALSLKEAMSLERRRYEGAEHRALGQEAWHEIVGDRDDKAELAKLFIGPLGGAPSGDVSDSGEIPLIGVGGHLSQWPATTSAMTSRSR